MIRAQEVETSIIFFIHSGYKIESAKTHGRQLTILIPLFIFLSFILILFFVFFFLSNSTLFILILLAASLFEEGD